MIFLRRTNVPREIVEITHPRQKRKHTDLEFNILLTTMNYIHYFRVLEVYQRFRENEMPALKQSYISKYVTPLSNDHPLPVLCPDIPRLMIEQLAFLAEKDDGRCTRQWKQLWRSH